MSVNSATHFGVPGASEFDAGRVTNPDQSEVQRQGLYDALLYPAAGANQLTFFAFPIGSGITTAMGAVAGSVKTAFDTNLQLANQLPSGKAFQLQSVELSYDPGSVSTANTFTLAMPTNFIAAAAATQLQMLNDVYTFFNSGRAQLQVLDKFYIDEAPLINFPQQVGVTGDLAVASNSATTSEVAGNIGRGAGRPYVINLPFTLQPAMNFSFLLTWPGLVAMPSTFNGRVRVRFDGYFLRSTQ